MGDVYFISDIHIGAGDTEKEQEKLEHLFSFFNYIEKPGNKLFIVGDLFDFWFEYKHVVPNKYYRLFFRFSKLIEQGVEIHFLPGNHDYWIRDFFEQEIGFIVHQETYQTEIDGVRFFLFHGDGVSKKDKGYQLLKKVFRNPVNIFLYRLLHPDLGVPLASFSSHTSRKHTANKILNDEADYLEYAVDKFKKGFDCVIMGHSHNPLIEKVDGKYLINLGDWIDNFTYGLFSNGKISLNYWKIKNETSNSKLQPARK
ncbi:UDP-2,3-diacylglucosamine diphosphatase [candidate division KSB1 bacterium]|nr:UDP-2,3-diacylglucosamine diphosphatase [candidate division KSB1 bacterium]